MLVHITCMHTAVLSEDVPHLTTCAMIRSFAKHHLGDACKPHIRTQTNMAALAHLSTDQRESAQASDEPRATVPHSPQAQDALSAFSELGLHQPNSLAVHINDLPELILRVSVQCNRSIAALTLAIQRLPCDSCDNKRPMTDDGVACCPPHSTLFSWLQLTRSNSCCMHGLCANHGEPH